MNRLTALMGAAVIAGSAQTAVAQDASTVVATVGDTEITLGEMIIARAQLPAQYDQFPADVLFEGIVDQLVQQELLAASLTDVPSRVALSLANEERSLKAGEVITALTGEAVTEEAVQARYDEIIAEFEANPATEYNASHLLVETEEEAQAAAERAADEDFAALAMELSTGPSGPNGGELGWFSTGAMVPEFEAAVVDMEVGAVSAPVQTQFGWHVIKLNDTRPVAAPDLEEVRGEISSAIQEEAITARIAELRDATAITLPETGAIDAELLNNLELLEP
ncbi:peptidyl-prolyl cis-trans isomerase C [Loktanella sp. DSM 29012]|uniref:peptidylprolyl isomerase n=1 Tax=Loktanella sp. DSM 29012 TaxID=1881056 RepID=UPI0008B730A5|nr:peptidylprolyl isomerase [Loktanella sp. DSM 29012]SEP59437.1 peptidyl-prolyl cis-trans isomerase C [Loktanella sp. DSM 29012]